MCSVVWQLVALFIVVVVVIVKIRTATVTALDRHLLFA